MDDTTQEVDHKRQRSTPSSSSNSRVLLKNNGPGETAPFCHHWLGHRRRYCGQEPLSTGVLCGQHVKHRIDSKTGKKHSERVPCPLYPGHTVSRKRLKAHLFVCPHRPREHTLPFYNKDINVLGLSSSSSVGEEGTEGDPQSEEGEEGEGDDNDKHNEAAAAKAAHYLHRVPREEFDAMREKIERLWQELDVGGQIVTSVVEEEHHLPDALNTLDRQKHLRQCHAIVKNMDAVGLLSKEHCYVELGAGRALLTLTVGAELGGVDAVVVDRQASRTKAENKMASLDESCQTRRYRVDIKDMDLRKLKVPFIDGNQTGEGGRTVVVTGKHLCGAGTDLGLVCALRAANGGDAGVDKESTTDSEEGTHVSRVHGIAIAVCCHHVCNHAMYVNPEYVESTLELDKEGFQLLTKLSSWATLAKKTMLKHGPNAENERVQGMSFDERLDYGRKCKRLLDWGRVLHLREQGFEAGLVEYCEPSTSVENVMIVAWRAQDAQ